MLAPVTADGPQSQRLGEFRLTGYTEAGKGGAATQTLRPMREQESESLQAG